MKTSNKLLLGGIIIITVSLIGSALYFSTTVRQNHVKGSGSITDKHPVLAAFNEVKAYDLHCHYVPSDTQKVVVSVHDNLHEFLTLDVEDSVLTIKYKEGSFSYDRQPRITIYYNRLKRAKQSTGSCSGKLQGDMMSLKVSAGARADLEISCTQLKAKTSSGAETVLKGQCENAFLSTSSGASLNARDLLSKSCIVSASSGSEARVFAQENLSVDASSGSDVRYYGNPAGKQLESSSGAEITAGN